MTTSATPEEAYTRLMAVIEQGEKMMAWRQAIIDSGEAWQKNRLAELEAGNCSLRQCYQMMRAEDVAEKLAERR
jgi:hypothetical protein